MSSKGKYVCITRINIEHEYFKQSLIPVKLVPDYQVIDYFKKHSIHFKRIHNSWGIFGDVKKREFLMEDFRCLRFTICPFDDTFYFVSEKMNDESEEYLVIDNEKSINQEIDIVTGIPEINIKIKSPSKHFEYIVFPKSVNADQKIEIVDLKGIAVFDNFKLISWINGEKVFQFRTRDKMKLTQKSIYNIKVIEKLDYGDRILLNDIPMPKPRSLSIYNPQQIITAFYTI
jgi:hypothetical protein